MLINNPQELSHFIKEARKASKLSQTEVADQVGLQQNTISEFEIRPEGTKLDTLFRILAATKLQLHITPREELAAEQTWDEQW